MGLLSSGKGKGKQDLQGSHGRRLLSYAPKSNDMCDGCGKKLWSKKSNVCSTSCAQWVIMRDEN